MARTLFLLALLGFLATPFALACEEEEIPDLAASLAKAKVEGKYRMLLRQIRVDEDREGYGEFRDWGPWNGTAYREHRDLPPGHWVWVAPYWYVWRDIVSAVGEARPWGPEQATGAPTI